MNKKAIIVLSVLLWCTVQSVGAEGVLKKVVLVPHWIPQAQFAGYMVALDKGFYRDVSLDLSLMQGGPEIDPFDALEAGKVTFAVGWLSSAIKRRASGLPVVNIAQIVQRSALLIVARKSSGIVKPQDLNGRKVALWGGDFNIPPAVFFRMHDATVKAIPNYSSIGLFLKGAVDATVAMWYNEYHTILNSGLNKDDLTVFPLSEYRISFPEDGLYCMEDTFRSDPQMCLDFVEASLRGWTWAFDNPEEALNIVMKYADAAHTGTNRAHQRWMLARMKDLMAPRTEFSRIGRLLPEDYGSVGNLLKELSVPLNLPRFEDFYRGHR